MRVNSIANYNNKIRQSTNFKGLRRIFSTEQRKNLNYLDMAKIENLTVAKALSAIDTLSQEKVFNYPEVTKNIISENASLFSNSRGIIDIGAMIENFQNVFNSRYFLQATQNIGDVSVFRRENSSFGVVYKPVDVSVVKLELPSSKDSKKDTFFAFFEKGYEKAKTNEELDTVELGLMEVSVYDWDSLLKPFEFSRSPADNSIRAVKNVYRGEKSKSVDVSHLLSYEGDKFKGIGTKFLDLASQYSRYLGFDGRVSLYAENAHPSFYYKDSVYCKKMFGKSPVGFYYKAGLRADSGTNRRLAEVIRNGGYSDIQGVTMYMPLALAKKRPDAIKDAKFNAE